MSKLAFAIQMEVEGGRYYTQQAEHNQGNPLHHVFTLLAAAEKKHEDLLRNRVSGQEFVLDDDPSADANNVFAGLGDFKADPGLHAGQLDVYRTAIEIEQKSIDLYTDMLENATIAEERHLLQYLAKQERSHLELFENLVTLVQRPEEWVESAEFGERAEY